MIKLIAAGNIDIDALKEELEHALGPAGSAPARWNIVVEMSENGNAVALSLEDEGIDSTVAQAVLDAHVARWERRHAIAALSPHACPRCGGAEWRFGLDRYRGKTVQLAVFTAILLIAAAGMRLAHVTGAWVPAALALIVAFQGALKWGNYTRRYCVGCLYATHDWGGRPAKPAGWDECQEKLRHAEERASLGDVAEEQRLLKEVITSGHPTQQRLAQSFLDEDATSGE